jgi:hypothetical protein
MVAAARAAWRPHVFFGMYHGKGWMTSQSDERTTMQKKRWADLSAMQRIGILIGATIQFGLLAGGLWDLAHRKPDEVRGDRRFWAGFMFVNWIGPVSYFAYGRKKPIWECCAECCGRKSDETPVIEETGEVDAV